MNNTSRLVVNCVRDLNVAEGTNIAAYSIDAGFHVFVFTLAKDVDKVRSYLEQTCQGQLERVIETEIDSQGVE